MTGESAMGTEGFHFDSWGVSDRGCLRELNEDRFFAEPSIGVWVVADGMGGHDAGEVASAAIVDQMATIGVPISAPDLRARFEDRLLRANQEIRAASAARNGAVIGSTVAGLITYGGQYACIWSGDSRVYRVRFGEISQISTDHTEVQELLDKGLIDAEQARTWPRRNVITRAIGVTADVNTEIRQGQIESGDIFILCSDGLTAHVEPDEVLQAVTDAEPRAACEKLLSLTLERGGTDNVTIIVVQCEGRSGTIPVRDDGHRPPDVPG